MSLFSGLASIAAPIVGGLFGSNSAKKQNAANQDMMRDQQAFEERMSSTAYQRSMADMRNAGLNPMLAYQQGGASTPSVGMIPSVSEGDQASTGVSSAINAMTSRETLKNLKETNKNISADTEKKRSDTDLNAELRGTQQFQQALLGAQHSKTIADTLNARVTQQILGQNLVSARAAAAAALREEAIDKSDLGGYTRKINRVMESVLGAGRAANSAKSLF